EGKRAEFAGALVEHAHREAGATELAALVGGVAAVEQVAHLHHRDLVAFGQDQLAAVGQGGVLQVGEVELRERVDLRHALAAVDGSTGAGLAAGASTSGVRSPGSTTKVWLGLPSHSWATARTCSGVAAWMSRSTSW